MSQDPYGYDESPADAGAMENRAVQVLWTGIGAMACFLIAPCLCYLPYFVSVPLGGYAMFAGLSATGAEARGTRNMALAGVLTGALGAVFSGMVLLILGGYAALIILVAAFGDR